MKSSYLIATIIIGLGAAMHTAGVTLSKWSVNKIVTRYYSGPLKTCTDASATLLGVKVGGEVCKTVGWDNIGAAHRVSLVLAMVAIPLGLVAAALHAISFILSLLGGSDKAALVKLGASGATIAGAMSLVSVGVWILFLHSWDNNTVGGAMIVSAVGGAVMILGGGQSASGKP